MAARLHIPARNLLSSFTSSVAVAALSATLSLPLFSKRRKKNQASSVNILLPDIDGDEDAFQNQTEPERCHRCNGYGTVPCDVCKGLGTLRRGGFSRRNSIRVLNLVGSKWTSTTAIGGKWRHFLCIGKRGSNNIRNSVAQLTSTCGPVEKRVKIDVPVSNLKSREQWQAGWTTLSDIRAEGGSNDGVIGGVGATKCSACKGDKVVLCGRCDGLGQVGL